MPKQLFKLSKTTQAYIRWRWCETRSKDAWKKDECKKLYEKYHEACLKKNE